MNVNSEGSVTKLRMRDLRLANDEISTNIQLVHSRLNLLKC
jgi:hypothetical protein